MLCIYVPRTRGTYSGGYCYDYLGISSASITLTYEYLQSDGTMATTSVAAGSAARLNITAYNSAYTHKVVWKFGSYSATQSIAAGTTYASYTIPLSWLSAIPNATSGAATVTLETIDTTGASLGSYSYGFTITVPASVVPTISSVSAAPVNDNATINGWGIYVYGKSKALSRSTAQRGAWLVDQKLLHHHDPKRRQFFRVQFHHGLSLRHQCCDRHRQGNGLPRQNGDKNHHVFGL